MATEKKYYRVMEKGQRSFVVDLDGNPVQPKDARNVAQAIIETANAPSYVYIGYRESDELYKIGRTIDPQRRENELGIEFFHTIECDLYGDKSAVKIEKVLHDFFKSIGLHREGEWFDLNGNWENALKLVDLNKLEYQIAAWTALVNLIKRTVEEHGLFGYLFVYSAIMKKRVRPDDLGEVYYATFLDSYIRFRESNNRYELGYMDALLNVWDLVRGDKEVVMQQIGDELQTVWRTGRYMSLPVPSPS